MNIKKLIEKLTANWVSKVICLILAFFLYVFNKSISLQKKTFSVPLTVQAEGLMMPAQELPKFVKVLVTTTAENMAFIQNVDFKATVNFDNFVTPGEYTVPIVINVSEKLMEFDTFECRPKLETLHVLLDEKVLKYIPVEVASSGSPTNGYKIDGFDVTPATVKVVGPSRIVEKIKHIYTKKVIVDGAALSFSVETKLDNVNSKISILPESDYKVTVKISEQFESRKYTKIVPDVWNLNENLELSSEIPSVDLTVNAPVLTLNSFNPDGKNVFIDMGDITEAGEYELPIQYAVPTGIKLESKSDETVFVKVIAKTLKTEEVPENTEKVDTTEDKNEESKIKIEEPEKKAE